MCKSTAVPLLIFPSKVAILCSALINMLAFKVPESASYYEQWSLAGTHIFLTRMEQLSFVCLFFT